jgi:hypothetical protein
MIGAEFRERYVLTRFPSDGLIVDLTTGNFFRLNPSATIVCDALATCATEDEAREQVSRELAVPASVSAEIVAAARRELSVAAVRGVPQGTYRFLPDSQGYALWHGDHPVLSIDGDSLAVRVSRESPPYSMRVLELYLRNIAPKLLASRGVAVLHGAAIALHGRLIGFSGVSGAGKTTTARAFASNSATLVSEDLLVFDSKRDGAFRVSIQGEAFVHEWARTAAARLADGHTEVVTSDSLTEANRGETLPIRELYFLDADRRSGTDFTAREIHHAESLAEIMNNNFLASTNRGHWRRFTEFAVALSTSTRTFRATPPAGRALVDSAARVYMSTWTS